MSEPEALRLRTEIDHATGSRRTLLVGSWPDHIKISHGLLDSPDREFTWDGKEVRFVLANGQATYALVPAPDGLPSWWAAFRMVTCTTWDAAEGAR